jgi:hypothetical protein
MKRRRVLLLCSCLALLAALALGVEGLHQAGTPPTRVLPDGMRVSLEAVITQPPYEFTLLEWWQKPFGSLLLSGRAAKAQSAATYTPSTGCPVVWTSFRGGWLESLSGGRVAMVADVCDETRRLVTTLSETGTVRLRTPTGREATVVPWELNNYPRRVRTIRLRLDPSGGLGDRRGHHPVAEFAFLNPLPGPYPTWKPSPLPAEARDGDLRVRLTSFRSGRSVNEVGFGVIPTTARHAVMEYTVVELGRVAPDWRAYRVDVHDATGNRWVDLALPRIGVDHNARPNSIAIPDRFTTGESAWKLTVHLRRGPEKRREYRKGEFVVAPTRAR